MKQGLKPKSKDIRHKYPPRIYVTDNVSSLYGLIKELKRWKGIDKYTILEINTTNLNLKLYKDLTSLYKGNYYIQDIPVILPENIKILETNI